VEFSNRTDGVKIIGVIPSRFASTRFPGKPLCDICGKTMIQRVYERASEARHLDGVIVATDDERIFKEVRSFGGEVSMTSESHPDGTSRVAETVRDIDCDIVINIQGDEPFIDPSMIDETASLLISNPDVPASTLAFVLQDHEDVEDPNMVKVVRDLKGKALYFSRSPIPFMRYQIGAEYLGHIGIYGYRKAFLEEIVRLPATPLSSAESLEQLKILEKGYDILVGVTSSLRLGPGIDTPEDLEKARAFCSEGQNL